LKNGRKMADEVQRQIYNLILNPATRDWERQILVETKENMAERSFNSEIDRLASELRPLAIRNNLTPDVMDFYLTITGEPPIDTHDKLAVHEKKDPPYQERAIFAGGCFWCMVEPFDQLPGIIAVISGYAGGTRKHPTYDEVVTNTTGHVECVEILFDRRKITYQQLLTIYWSLIDPTDNFGQFDDRGENYKPIIFVANKSQRLLAEKSKADLIRSKQFKKPIVVEIREAPNFWVAENYHQDFYKKNVRRYRSLKRSRNIFLTVQQVKKAIRLILKKM